MKNILYWYIIEIVRKKERGDKRVVYKDLYSKLGEAVEGVKITKRYIAFKMFEEGIENKEVAKTLELTPHTTETYRSRYRNSIGTAKVKVKKPKIDEVTQEESKENIASEEKKVKAKKERTKKAPTKEAIQDVMEDIKDVEKFIFYIGIETYLIDKYLDQDGNEWFDLSELMYALSNELYITLEDVDTFVNKRYIKVAKHRGKQITMIDKHILPHFANSIGDYSFIATTVDTIVNNQSTFLKAHKMVEGLKCIEEFVFKMDKKEVEIGAFNNIQTDLIHEIEKMPRPTEQELLEKITQLRNLRVSRREVRNAFTFGQVIKNELRSYNTNAGNIKQIRLNMQRLLKNLYIKRYNNRVEQLEDWQREVADLIKESLNMEIKDGE